MKLTFSKFIYNIYNISKNILSVIKHRLNHITLFQYHNVSRFPSQKQIFKLVQFL